MKKVMVTGCSGMDGSNLSDWLLANTDAKIYGVVRRLSVPNHKNLKSALGNSRFKLVSGDLGDQISIDNLVRDYKPDYLINFAAQSFVGESWNSPENTFNINTLGVLRCLESVRRIHPTCRFYSAGSSEEWGDVQYSPQDINHPIRPRSPYGASKASSRHLVKVYRESYNLYALHGILFNHEGTRRGAEFVTRKITKGVARIYHAIQRAVNQGSVIRYNPIQLGNLDAKRDWSDSEDFVEGVWRILNQDNYRQELKDAIIKPSPKGGILIPVNLDERNTQILSPLIKEYVLASGETHTVREFVEKAFRTAGIEGYWERTGLPEEEKFLSDSWDNSVLVEINPQFYRPAEVDLLIGDSTPARNELGWSPKVSFNQLVDKMVRHDIETYE